MNKIIFITLFVLFSINLNAADKSEMILNEIKELRIDMNKKFEQVDKRLDFMQDILYMLMGLIFASSFIVIYVRDKKEAEDRKNFEHLKGILFVLRKMAQDDAKMEKTLKSASLL